MRKLLTILIVLLNICLVNGQKYKTKTLTYENCKEFIFNKKNRDTTIYNIKATELQTLIKCKEKKFTLLYVFSPSCRSVVEKMIDVTKLLKNKQTDILFVSIEKDNSKWQYEFYNFFINVGYTYPLFAISEAYSKRSEKRLKLFLQELSPENDYKNIGAGSLILFDINGNLIYYSDFTYDHPVEDVEKIINNE